MKLIERKHDRAMDYAEQAWLLSRRGKRKEALVLNQKAFKLEREAALALQGRLEEEPARSVLFRSAATLAADCGELREAERLVALALSGNPPGPIADELRELLAAVAVRLHPQKVAAASPPRNGARKREGLAAGSVEVTGFLRFADDRSEDAAAIKISDSAGREFTVLVDKGRLQEIVRPHFGAKVRVVGRMAGRKPLTIRMTAIGAAS